MPKENEKQRIFSRRALILAALQASAFAALVSRLFYLQFIKASEYATLSENNRIKLQIIEPDRGKILDRGGVKMADNQQNYRLFIDYSTLNQKTFLATVERLKDLLPINDKKLKQLQRAKVSAASMPEMLKEHLSWDEVSLVELHMLELPGAFIDTGQIRFYPYLDYGAHLIGYIAAIAESELKDDDPPLLHLPDFKIGKSGVEKMLEERLQGIAGLRQLEVNVHGVPVREIGKKDSIAGENVKLTIDAELQNFTADLVKKESAGVVVIETDTGNILTLASMPAFDPNNFSKGITTDYWKELSNDKKSPLLNKATAGQYPPGSTFKMMVGLAGLESGTITPETAINCPGYFMLGDHRFNCWRPSGHGTVHYHEAIQQSCDTFFYTVAQRLGIEKYAEMARAFGLGQSHDIGLLGEKPGIIPDPDWKMKRYKQRWTGGDTINCAIGQGYVLATPLQMAVMTARIASGNEVKPRLVVPAGEEKPEFKAMPVQTEFLQATHEAMSAVANNPGGTAYAHRITDPRYLMAGKTGTSQVRKIVVHGQNQNSIPWEFRHHAWFVGFAPVTAPKYAIAVLVEHGGGGSSAAAPIAQQVLLKIQQKDAPQDSVI